MINNCNNSDKERIIELGKLISDNFDRVNNIDKIIENKEIIGYYEDDILVGFIIFKTLYDVTDLLYIVVDEEYRNKKIGSRLMDYLINNSKKIMLEVRCDNKSAINLYKKYNFMIINIRKKYYNDMDGYVMELML